MTNCRFEFQIDDYLLDRLPEPEKGRFEEHYFNCAFCFKEIKARSEILEVIKGRGKEIFAGQPERASSPSVGQSIGAFLKAKRWWAVSAVAVSALLVLFLVFSPPSAQRPPTFTLGTDDTVRGEILTLLAPVNDVSALPEFFEWKPLSSDVEYQVSLFDGERLWSETTRECRIRLPEEVRQRMTDGQAYTWQVKAFSPQGSLRAASGRVRFKIIDDN